MRRAAAEMRSIDVLCLYADDYQVHVVMPVAGGGQRAMVEKVSEHKRLGYVQQMPEG